MANFVQFFLEQPVYQGSDLDLQGHLTTQMSSYVQFPIAGFVMNSASLNFGIVIINII